MSAEVAAAREAVSKDTMVWMREALDGTPLSWGALVEQLGECDDEECEAVLTLVEDLYIGLQNYVGNER